ncbi:hypothetical protein [Bradyrhizobium sp. PRIMUS42]|uniref:hypothetical protein n=1 Tax=Bradyrhizobium sp. PRIMUS42 TaxID=2908926 RepID=UPI0028681A41|nr:hypothetical protein [Bradyrhizobium sp. PRIMUS42]
MDQGCVQLRAALEDDAGILKLTIEFTKQLLQQALLNKLVPEAVQDRVIRRCILKTETHEALE